MPGFRRDRRNPEDAPEIGGPDNEPRVPTLHRPQSLTLELLNWLIAALEAVLTTPQVQEFAMRRAEASLRDALKQADKLYPTTEEVRRATSEERHRALGRRAVLAVEDALSSSSHDNVLAAGASEPRDDAVAGPNGDGLP